MVKVQQDLFEMSHYPNRLSIGTPITINFPFVPFFKHICLELRLESVQKIIIYSKISGLSDTFRTTMTVVYGRELAQRLQCCMGLDCLPWTTSNVIK